MITACDGSRAIASGRRRLNRRIPIDTQIADLETRLNDFAPDVRAQALEELASLAQAGSGPVEPEDDVANMHCHTFFSFNAYGHSPSSLAWLAKRRGFKLVGIVDFDVLDGVDVVICPAYTALWPLAQALRESRLQLGGQNIAATAEPARTGQVSAQLLRDVGCRWVMLGHWEIRRHLGDDDDMVNAKVHLALGAGLAPMAVQPEFQRKGVGSALVNRGLDELRSRSCPFVVVLGHPEYYPRFGFERAWKHGLQCQWEGVPDEAFMVMIFEPCVMPEGGGVARYRDEFDAAM